MVCLGSIQGSFLGYEIAPQYCILDSFVDYENYSISSKGFLPTVVDIMVIWVKLAHSGLFQFTDSWIIDVYLDHSQFTLVHDTTLMAESEEELKSLLMRVKEESENAGLKLNIQKTKMTVSVPITSHCQTDWETVETVTDFTFLGSKITKNSDCSHEIKTYLLLGRKAITNIGSILERGNITLPTKVHIVKAMVFLVVMHGCDSWTIKKAESWRTDAFAPSPFY